jgi:DNA-binding transcriptional ArsR family regulator
MSGSEDEPYSTIFASLKHPVRRKMLRMLFDNPRSFSEMLEALNVSSSHLTYHLENLAELVSKEDDGRYKLSAFGEAAVATMSRVEETRKITEPKHPLSLPIKWKSLFVALLVGLVILSGVSYVQYQSLNKMSDEYGQLNKFLDWLKEGASFQTEYNLSCGYTLERIGSFMMTTSGSATFNGLTVTLTGSTLMMTTVNGSLTVTPINVVPLLGGIGNSFLMVQNDSSLMIFGVQSVQGPSSCAVYNPCDNCTLDLVVSLQWISPVQPLQSISPQYISLVVQKGNALDFGTDETTQVIWSVNATETGTRTYPILLPSQGWYTISLAGPMYPIDPHAICLRVDPFGEANCSASLKIMHEGTASPFIAVTKPIP